jgi:pimeloyl-ACP methyl ester carboxylesterase
MADDLESFVLEKDLYVRPVAVVGAGVGGAVALAFAGRHPRLCGALVLLDYTPFIPSERISFHPLQTANFSSAHAAAPIPRTAL